MVFLIILMAVGLLFILTEILIVPGAIVAGVLGITALGCSCVYAFIEFGSVPGTVVTVFNVAVTVVMMIYMIRSGIRRRMDISGIGRGARLFEDCGINVGDSGKALTGLAPHGMAEIGPGRVEVVSLEGTIDAGADVVVVLIEDGKIYVKPSEEEF